MTTLRRKLWRDLARGWREYVALALMVGVGLAAFVAAYQLYRNLRASYDHTYQVLHFEDFRIALRLAPPAAATLVAALPGVERAEGRLQVSLPVDLPRAGGVEAAAAPAPRVLGRFISLPAPQTPAVDGVLLTGGAYPANATARDVLVESSFARAHDLRPGSRITVVAGRARIPLTIAGIVDSPEYLYAVASREQPLPSPDTFGVFFISGRVLDSLLGKGDRINQVVATLAPGADLGSVMTMAAQRLRAWSPDLPVPRDQQPSWMLLEQDLEGLAAFAWLFPLLFLGIAAVTVASLMQRLVTRQRPVIGLMRALGYTRRQVQGHYLGLALAVGMAGSVGGGLVGAWLAGMGTRLYATFVTLPLLDLRTPWMALAIGGAAGMTCCLAGGWRPARRAAGMGAAEAMRPLTPTAGRVVHFRRGRSRAAAAMPLFWRLPLRNLFRQPRRTLVSAFGVAAALILMLTAGGLQDSFTLAVNQYLEQLHGSSLAVQYAQPVPAAEVARLAAVPGVTRAEPQIVLALNARRAGAGELSQGQPATLVALPRGGLLQRLQSLDGETVTLPPVGALVGQELQRRLALRPGDSFEVALPSSSEDDIGIDPGRERRRWRTLLVAGVLPQAVGTMIYLPMAQARSLFADETLAPAQAVTGARVETVAGMAPAAAARIRRLPQVAAVQITARLRRQLDTLTASYRGFIAVMQGLAVLLALAVIFNLAWATAMERVPEMATLRTLGFRAGAIGSALLLENLLATLLGLLVGWPLGLATLHGFVLASQSPAFSFRTHMSFATAVLSLALVLGCALAAQLPGLAFARRVNLAQAVRQRVV